jgi:hypothetical protein
VDSTLPPAPGNPLSFIIEVDRAGAALRVESDHEHGLVAVLLAAEPRARCVLAPEGALDLALLVGAVSVPRRAPGS